MAGKACEAEVEAVRVRLSWAEPAHCDAAYSLETAGGEESPGIRSSSLCSRRQWRLGGDRRRSVTIVLERREGMVKVRSRCAPPTAAVVCIYPHH